MSSEGSPNLLYPESPGVTGQILPLNRDPQGNLHLAVPGFIHDIVNSSFNALVGPGEIAGAVNPLTMQPAHPDPLRVASDISGTMLGMGAPMPGVPGGFSSFKGWHGTPHVFEPVEGNPFGEFRDDKIGTGEGAQVYGYGHYVAGARQTAEEYQKALSTSSSNPTITLNGVPVWDHYGAIGDKIYEHPEHIEEAAKAMQLARGDLNEAKSILTEKMNDPGVALQKDPWIIDAEKRALASGRLSRTMLAAHSENAKDALDFLANNPNALQLRDSSGSLLHLEIKPEESELLDWDQPLRKMPEQVQDKVRPLLQPTLDKMRQENERAGMPPYDDSSVADSMRGEDIYNHLGHGPEASSALRSAGIPGIKYLDQFSRGLREPEEIQADLDNHNKFLNEIAPPLLGEAKANNDIATARGIRTDMKAREKLIARLQDELSRAQNKTSNYVIFDPKNIQIVGRNGQMLQMEETEDNPFEAKP